MKIKKLCNQQYEILSKDNDIYITRHKNPGTDIYIYFISIWEFDLNGQLIEDECFDELDHAKNYIKDNYNITDKIINKINWSKK